MSVSTTEVKQKIYSVSEVTRAIRLLLESKFRAVWVEGEISNFKHHSSGHIYFTLKDEKAQISCVFFARENQFLKFEVKDGLRVICIGRISVYDVRGQYQIYVQRMEPKGLGALQLAFEQLKERLEKEGFFKLELKKRIPAYPRRIGVVTSPTGAAIQDMLKIFKKRFYGLEVLLIPVRVQGDGAAKEISAAISQFNGLDAIDLLIIGRGGGSLEDLWAFNEEVVARAIANSEIPIISAVGHEIDWTISDFVADARAHTPTAAAEAVVAHWDELDWRLRQSRERMQIQIRSLLEVKHEQLDNLKESYAFRQPKVYLERLLQRADELLRQLQDYLKRVVVEKRQSFVSLVGKLEALSPLESLERGYSITFDAKGQLLKDSERVQVGDMIQTKLKSGAIQSEVKKIGAS